MKKILFTVVFISIIVCGFSSMKFTTVNIAGENTDVSFDPMTWNKMGGDVNKKDTFDENADLQFNIGQRYPDFKISAQCVNQLKYNFRNGIFEKVLVVPGNKFDLEFYGGVTLPRQKVVLATITIGNGFDIQFKGRPASCYMVSAIDEENQQIVYDYWFKNGLNDKTQCNNFCVRYEPLPPQPKIEPKVEIIREIEYIELPPVIVHDTVRVEVFKEKEVKHCVKISAWTSFAHDHFNEPADSIFNAGPYTLSNYYNSRSGHFIFATEQEVTAKACFNSNAFVVNIYHEYEDGPHGGNLRTGWEKNFTEKAYMELGLCNSFREFTTVEVGDSLLHNQDGDRLIWTRERYHGSFETGPYLQIDEFFNSGQNHLHLYGWQGFRPSNFKVGISEIKGSLKLELDNLYLFGEGKYQHTPYEYFLSNIIAPQFDHTSYQLRVGYAQKRVIWFLRHRAINHDQETYFDIGNKWSKYRRRDFSVGVFYRPTKLLGIKNLYLEFLTGYTNVKELYDNEVLDNESDLMEVKLTLFYGWKF